MAVEHPPPPLPVVRVAEIPREDQPTRWLVDQLWGDSSVGLIGGAPKCSKTWLGLDLALSVATGTACLGKYAVPRPGPVLVYLAEDALPVLRQRVAGMARHRGLDLADVEMYVITAPTLRLDRDPHRSRLLETAKRRRPRLVLLDPLVRLHGIDENNAGEVAGLLAYFRALQRQLDLSVILVHHTRKNAAAGAAAGQGLRGSSDLHAFGDSNLYLRRTSHRLLLSSEHRAAPRFAAGVPGADRHRRPNDPSGSRGRGGRPEAGQYPGSGVGPACRRRRANARGASRRVGRQKPTAGRGPGVVGASRPDPSHLHRLATRRVPQAEGRSRSPSRETRERNGPP